MNRSHIGLPAALGCQSDFQGIEEKFRIGQSVDYGPWKVSPHSCELKTFASSHDSGDIHDPIDFERIEKELINIIDDGHTCPPENTLDVRQTLVANARSAKVRSIYATSPTETSSFSQNRIDWHPYSGSDSPGSPSGELSDIPQECLGYLNSSEAASSVKPEIIESRREHRGACGTERYPNDQLNLSTDYQGLDEVMPSDETVIDLLLYVTHRKAQQQPSYGEKKNIIRQWREFEERANDLKEGSREWEQVWKEAYYWALKSSEKDWMCFLSVGKVLTRLKKFSLAEWILQYQLRYCPYFEKYNRAIYLQLAFIYFSKKRHAMAIEYYMRGIFDKKFVSDTMYSYIEISMKRLNKNQNHYKYDEKFLKEANDWFSLLRADSELLK